MTVPVVTHDPVVHEVTANGIRLRLKVQPKSRRAGPQGFVAEPDGAWALKFGVQAAPEDGRANAAVIALLAKHLGVAKAAISVAAGAKDRRKVIDIRGHAGELAAALAAWLAPLYQDMTEQDS